MSVLYKVSVSVSVSVTRKRAGFCFWGLIEMRTVTRLSFEHESRDGERGVCGFVWLGFSFSNKLASVTFHLSGTEFMTSVLIKCLIEKTNENPAFIFF